MKGTFHQHDCTYSVCYCDAVEVSGHIHHHHVALVCDKFKDIRVNSLICKRLRSYAEGFRVTQHKRCKLMFRFI